MELYCSAKKVYFIFHKYKKQINAINFIKNNRDDHKGLSLNSRYQNNFQRKQTFHLIIDNFNS